MMGLSLIKFCAWEFVGFTLINRIMEGAFIAAADISILNTVVIFRTVEIWGLGSIPVPNVSFLTQGIPALISWDYSFFGGNAAIISYLFYVITAAVAFVMFVLAISAFANVFSRSRI